MLTATRDWAAYRSLSMPRMLAKLAAFPIYRRREIQVIATQLWEPKLLTASLPEVTQIAQDAAGLFCDRTEGMKGRVMIDLMQHL